MATYNAFMSYSHAGDGALAAALQSALHRFARPWNRVRALHVFRDQTNLSVNPTLWPTIEAALDNSDYLIYLASPEAAGSVWVGRELQHWLERHGSERILIVLCAGTLEWDDTSGAMDRTRTDALPPAVLDSFSQEPLYLDLTWARGVPDVSLRSPRFRDAVAQLAAPLHGRPKDELIGEDVRQHRHARRLATAAVAGLTGLALAASVAAVLAVRQRNLAREGRAAATQQTRIALARQLAAQSVALADSPEDLDLALLLALESTDRFDSGDGNDALRRALTIHPRTLHSFPPEDPNRDRVRDLAFSPDGRLLAAARDNGATDVFDIVAGRVVGTLRHDEDPGAVVDQPGGGFSWKAAGVDEEVTSIAFGGDGRIIATGGNDGTARVWRVPDDGGQAGDADTRELLRVPHDSSVASVALNRDATLLATGSADGSLRLWDIASRRELLRLRYDEEVREVAFSPDDRVLAAIATDGGITIVDVAARRERLHWYAGMAGLGLAFDRDGRRLATASAEAALVWDVATGGKLLSVMHGSTLDEAMDHNAGWIDDVAFSPTGGSIATAGRDGTARVWSIASGQELIRVRHEAPVESVEFSADGASLVTSSFDGTSRLWDVATGRERLRAVHPDGSEISAFSPNGEQVASAGVDGSIRVWTTGSGDRVARVMHDREVTVVAFSKDGRRFATGDERGTLRIWSLSPGEGEPAGTGPDAARSGARASPVTAPVKLPVPQARRMIFSTDGSRLVTEWSDQVLLMNVPTGETMPPLTAFGSVAALHADYIADWDRTSESLRLWAANGGLELARLNIDDVRELAFDETGAVLAVAERTDSHGNGVVRLLALPALRPLPFPVPIESASLFAVAPGGRYIAVESREADAGGAPARTFGDVWDTSAGSRVARTAFDDLASFLGFDPAGGLLFGIGAADGSRHDLLAWDPVTGEPRARLAHETDIDAVRFSPEPNIVATVSRGVVRIWDASTGNRVSQLTDAAYVRDVRFSPDGRYLLTGDVEGAATVWLWKTRDLRDEACRRLERNLSGDEWRRYFGDLPYRRTCPALPDGSG